MTKQQLGQLNSHTPATAELACGSVQVITTESQTCECLFQFGLVIASAHHLVALALTSKTVYERMVLLTLVVRTLHQLVVQPLYLSLKSVQILKRRLSLLTYRAGIGQFHDLRQVTYGHLLGNGYRARSRLLQTGYDLEHGGLARSVLTHKGNTVLVTYHVADIMKERARPELNLKILYRKHLEPVLMQKVWRDRHPPLPVLQSCRQHPDGPRHMSRRTTLRWCQGPQRSRCRC